MPPAHQPKPQQDQCRYDGCPYIGDFSVIKTKLEVMDDKLDGLVANGHAADERLRYLEVAMARIDGIRSQAKWDARTIIMMAMFVLSFLGVALTVIKDLMV